MERRHLGCLLHLASAAPRMNQWPRAHSPLRTVFFMRALHPSRCTLAYGAAYLISGYAAAAVTLSRIKTTALELLKTLDYRMLVGRRVTSERRHF
jgi:hypothetical protein